MSSKQGKPQQQQQQKRKADAPAAQQQQPKKQKDQSGAAAAAPQQQAKKPAAEKKEQAPAAKKAAEPKEQPKKAAAKKAEPEPEPEEEEDDQDDEEGGAVNEEALKAIEAIQPEQDAIAAELDAFDEQQNAEIYAIQKKFLLKKRPVLAKRDQLVAKLPGLWKSLLSGHEVFSLQLEEVDYEILDNLTTVEVSENYAKAEDPKQQIESISIVFTFTAGKHVKAGKYTKVFKFNDEKEALEGVPTTKLPFVSPKFSDENKDSFFVSWFSSEGDDEGIIAAQDALTSELYVDPLQLYAHLASGGSLKDLQEEGDDDDDDDENGAMVFEEDDDDDDEAPELANE